MDEKQLRKSGDTVFPIITLSVTMETSGWIWPNFKLIQDLMYVSLSASMKRIWSRTANMEHRFSHYKLWGFFQTFSSRAANSAVSVVRAGWNSNSSELSCMSSLPASMKRIGWKTGEKKWRHRFLHYNPMGAFCCHGNQSSDLICTQKANAAFPPNPMMLQIQNCFLPVNQTALVNLHLISCLESVDTCTNAQVRTNTGFRLVYYKLTSKPSAQVS